jgi:O-antigen/teichoic acid export membrane protein
MKNNINNNLNTSRIAKNSILLFSRMIIVMIINLYTVRIVLKSLGAVDYGINDVVAGVVTILISLSSVLSTATQRYYSATIGEKKLDQLRNIFSTSVNIYLILSFIVIIFSETLGLWFVNNYLVIPVDRIGAANWIYQFSIFSFIFTILQVPFSAAVIAREDMGIFTIISTAECLLKFGAALIIFVVPKDRLVVYGVGLLSISFLVMLSYIVVGYFKYDECRYKKQKKNTLFRELITFSGWSFFGSLAGVGMFQFTTILINVFFGPLFNAARAISFQFNFAMSSLTASFLMALRPQMIKSYAEESYLYLDKIFNLSNKVIYYGLLIVSLPLFFEMNSVLFFWLNNTDFQTVLFSRLILIYTLIMSLNNPISIIIQAIGRVKEYHILVEIFTLLCVPVTYLLFKLGFPAYSTYIVMIIAAVASHCIRLICLKKFYFHFKYSEYFKSFLLPALFITLLSSFFIFFLSRSNINGLVRIPANFALSLVCVVSLVLMFGLSRTEKEDMKRLLIYFKRKIGKQ